MRGFSLFLITFHTVLTHFLQCQSFSLNGSVNKGMNFQGIVRDSNNMPVVSTPVKVEVSVIYGSNLSNSSSASTQVEAVIFSEKHEVTSDDFGIIKFTIGEGQPIYGDINDIDWSNTFLSFKIRAALNQQDYTISKYVNISPVPSAYWAEIADSIEGQFIDNPNEFQHYIGEYYQGGIIFYLWKDANGVEHGLIVSISDLSDAAIWGEIGNDIEGATDLLNGYSNTNAIVFNSNGQTNAANICNNYSFNGFQGWYLPSKVELEILIGERFDVNKSLFLIPNSQPISHDSWYWSSTQKNQNIAYAAGKIGLTTEIIKTTPIRVRAIRKF